MENEVKPMLNENNNELIDIIETNELLDDEFINTTNILEENSIDEQIENKDEIMENEKAVETNCLALTVRKNYNISIFKNTVVKTFKLSYKVIVSAFFLNLLKFFF